MSERAFTPDPALDAKLAEQQRTKAFYSEADLAFEEALVEVEGADMARADKFVQKKPLILVELDKRTGGSANQVTKAMVLETFEGLISK